MKSSFYFGIGLSVIGFACASGVRQRSAPGIVEALRASDQSAINSFTERFLAGGVRLKPKWLAEWSVQHIYIRIGGSREEGINHLGVERLGDYFLCLLEVRFKKTTAEILSDQGIPLTVACARGDCGVCFSEAWPVSAEARKILVAYWLERAGDWAE
ncbi:MAG TPA: hypothetical protein VN851_03910 [Thermoanaerobaculia bacterium]|nr:hypothetical protein [Thermoanaerobaculia bacterium]